MLIPLGAPLHHWQVLDEVQMVADESRGWAFTRALLGLPARTLHVCGDPAALPLLERILAETGGPGDWGCAAAGVGVAQHIAPACTASLRPRPSPLAPRAASCPRAPVLLCLATTQSSADPHVQALLTRPALLPPLLVSFVQATRWRCGGTSGCPPWPPPAAP